MTYTQAYLFMELYLKGNSAYHFPDNYKLS